ncbi:uncharacterized protein BO96DRAFT_21327 [Aspergillus niger CBS 101883]|uniref:uncharacterized protein n=1 Tax=Aspergillus lacticoffeatus (strain CBS 101883) TaxID=1450533 RepID=UPI000D7EDCE3|nr:uncharacterized protein BO96DRAFT_21327 [Aspergillus niger CBS 101883]PYH62751.1 hypothetical protein BO96DRAFT_21327 [Aspergillus niger CBS 101883]
MAVWSVCNCALKWEAKRRTKRQGPAATKPHRVRVFPRLVHCRSDLIGIGVARARPDALNAADEPINLAWSRILSGFHFDTQEKSGKKRKKNTLPSFTFKVSSHHSSYCFRSKGSRQIIIIMSRTTKIIEIIEIQRPIHQTAISPSPFLDSLPISITLHSGP